MDDYDNQRDKLDISPEDYDNLWDRLDYDDVWDRLDGSPEEYDNVWDRLDGLPEDYDDVFGELIEGNESSELR